MRDTRHDELFYRLARSGVLTADNVVALVTPLAEACRFSFPSSVAHLAARIARDRGHLRSIDGHHWRYKVADSSIRHGPTHVLLIGLQCYAEWYESQRRASTPAVADPCPKRVRRRVVLPGQDERFGM